jgi:hypothetical protein
MPGAEGNDHVRLLDNEGSSKRTDSVLSPEAIEGAERLQGDAVAAAGLTVGDTETVTGVATGVRDNPSIGASGRDGFDNQVRVQEQYTLPAALPADPTVIVSFTRAVVGVEVSVTATPSGAFEAEFVNARRDTINSGEAPINFVAVATE